MAPTHTEDGTSSVHHDDGERRRSYREAFRAHHGEIRISNKDLEKEAVIAKNPVKTRPRAGSDISTPLLPLTPRVPAGFLVEKNGETFIFGYISVQTYNLVVMSLAFMFMFSAYNTLQNFITTLLKENSLGDHSMLIVYIVVVVALFPAPYFVDKFGQRRCMFLGFFFYLMYMSSMLYVIDWLVLSLAVVAGIGTAIMWVAQGAYLTDLSTDDRRGLNCGIFFSIFQSSYVFGNVAAFFVFRGSTSFGLFVMFVILAALGTITLLMLLPFKKPSPVSTSTDDGYRPIATHEDETTAHTKEDESHGVVHLLMSSIRTLRYPMIIVLIPCFFFMGFELSFWTGEFSRLLKSESIGIVLSMAGLGEVIGASVIGWLSDKVGKTPTALVGMFFFFAAFAITTMIKEEEDAFMHPKWLNASWSAYVAAFCFGHGDGIINTLMYSLLGRLWPEEATPVFTVFQVFMDLGTAFGYFIFGWYPVHGPKGTLTLVWALLALEVVSFAGFIYADLNDVLKRRAETRERAASGVSSGNLSNIP